MGTLFEKHHTSLAETGITVVRYGVLDRREAVIRALYTAPEYRSHGRASAPLERFERTVRDGGKAS